MERTDFKQINSIFNRQLSNVDLAFKRYLYNEIDWDSRLIGIRGARGVGKTTLLLQYIKENFKDKSKVIWASLDNLWFKNHRLEDFVEYIYNHGVTTIFLDEVHKLDDWALYLKNFYDSYPDLKIVYTGSSMLEIDNSKVDLSRRQVLYTLGNMSFREYLNFVGALKYNALTLEQILNDHVNIAMDITSQIKVFPLFEKYLHNGCYPFFVEAKNNYLLQLNSVIQLVIESDMPSVMDVTYSTVEKIKRLLMLIVSNVPFVPNITKLAQILESSRDNCLKMLYALDKANIISLLTKQTKSYKHLASPEKVYLNNPNLMYALSGNVDLGNIRETFFFNQLQHFTDVVMPNQGDFFVDGKYLFEVGGMSKTFDQIKNIPNSFLVQDDMEVGFGNRIPLWLFGFLY
ncbi:MAG: ATP-binding protein [Bacteroidales bacterium]|nr:ATP-binding protein [Bacteroidales bacterium]